MCACGLYKPKKKKFRNNISDYFPPRVWWNKKFLPFKFEIFNFFTCYLFFVNKVYYVKG